ncbi:MAG: hypothetical protein IPI37_13515 [Bacteroidales bacterium]|nr:hypothetical protein [Bacteroidales bacterium]
MSRQNTVSGVGYTVCTRKQGLLRRRVKGVVATLNPHSYVIARRDVQFREALMEADLLIPDGTGIQLAARVLRGRRIEKIAGSDLHEVIMTPWAREAGRVSTWLLR